MESLKKEELFRKEFLDLYGEIDLNSLLNKIAEKISSFLNCAEASIFLYNSKKEELCFEIATGDKQDQLKKIVLKKGEGVVGWIAEHQERLIIDDCPSDPRFSHKTDHMTSFKTSSILGVPVIMEENFLGVLEAINKKEGRFNNQDAELLEFIAGFVSIPLQNAMLFKQITDETREKSQLIELGKTVSRAFSLEEVFDILKGIITDIIDPLEINVLVESQGKEYRLITNETVACRTMRLEHTLVDNNQVIIPLKSGKKRMGFMEVLSESRIPDDTISLIRGISLFAAISLEKFEMYREMVEKEKIEKELEIARDIQQSFLLSEKMELKGMDVAYVNIPSSRVGGDYYSIVPMSDEVTIFSINDVSGHGIPASLLMATFRINFTYRLKKDKNISDTIQHLNNLLSETTDRSHYVTSFTCKIDLKKKSLEYIRAGHNPPYIFRGDQIIELREGALPIGWFSNISYPAYEVELKKGDLVVMYTDGIIEAENAQGNQFSYARFKELVSANLHLDTEQLKEKLIEELTTFVEEDFFEDDVTFVLVKILE